MAGVLWYDCKMEGKIIEKTGITFDDVLLVPQKSDVVPSETALHTHLTRNISLSIPVVSAAMDTVTESALAIAIAREGGIGILHKNMTVDRQAAEVERVKRSESGVIFDPIILSPDETIAKAKEVMEERHIAGIPIVKDGRLVGIITSRDLGFQRDFSRKIEDVMTKDLVTAAPGTTLEEAREMLDARKVEKLPLVDSGFHLKGLITMKDINKTFQYPHSTRDDRGRLRVGAAIGVHDDGRTAALIENGVDVLVVDTAHGHSTGVLETIAKVKSAFNVDVIGGNIATADAAKDLVDAGADGIKIGIGPGSICTTRIVAGVGVPQITAIMECAGAVDVPILADGGIRHSGDISKAIAAGADTVMLGNLLAGLDESPGELVVHRGKTYKAYRGMGSLGAMVGGSKERYRQHGTKESDKLVPEGVEGRVHYKGKLADFVYQLIGGLRAGMGYCGAHTIEELKEKGRFTCISSAALVENHPHNIIITKESPNYRL